MTAACFLGDSFVFGSGGVTETQTFPRAMGARMGWANTRIGLGGTGFLAANGDGKVFADYIPAVVVANPGAVVIEGGLNDADSGFVVPVAAFFAALRAALPAVPLYVLGMYGLTPSRRAVLAAASLAASGLWIDCATWITGTGDTTHLAGDGNRDAYMLTYPHLTVAGHDYLGTRLAFSIRPPATGLV